MEAFFEKELTTEQMKDWYEELKFLSVERFRQTIREAKRNCKFLPKLSEFLDFIQATSTQIKEYESVDCTKCAGKGYLIYIKKIPNGNKFLEYEHVARCNCKNGERFAYDGTTMSNPKDKSKFHVPLVDELGL